ncbi:Abnormal spindle-like microcephaly-associated protein-like protein [Zootermopsis nevadensis]|uniref:Abnormal spindle-like microcephaly-associated protein-like protein n=1 Tax=Zootermopsis nevadensis TaxID=136037 RepID=A0A067RFJ0_ZOONE|nr:Abnormal spindle-like microcephaly-associated protein-like protein [Zootermopsis nevadensis]
MSAHTAGLSPSSTRSSDKAAIPQDTTADVADLVEQPEKEPLEVIDIHNEDELTLTEKPNESASELNGTVKADDDDSGKLIAAATGALAVISVAATVAAVTTNDEENKKPAEETKVIAESGSTNVSTLKIPANSNADNVEVTEDRDAKSPKLVKSEDEVVFVQAVSGENDSAAERKESASSSTPLTEEATIFSEEPPSESVPDNKLSTAISEEIPEQGRRATSASQIVVNEDFGGSRPTSAVAEGTIPPSASPTKEESVPEQQQHEETSMLPSGTPPTRSRPQSGTEERSRPVSATESNKEASRQINSAEFSKENREISENNTVEISEAAEVGNQVTTAEGADRPTSGVQGSEQPVSATGSVKEDVSTPQSVAESNEGQKSGSAESAVDNFDVSEEVNEIRPVSIAVSMKEESSRPVSVLELTTQERSRPASSAVDNIEVSEEPADSRPASAVKSVTQEENVASENEELAIEPGESPPINADEVEDGERESKISGVDYVETADSRPVSVIESGKESETRSVNAAQPSKEEEEEENPDVPEEPTAISPLVANESVAVGSRSENLEINTVQNPKETETCLPVVVSESTKEDVSQSGSIIEPNEEKESWPVHSTTDNTKLSEEPTRNGTVNTISEPTKEDRSQPISIIEPAMEGGPIYSSTDDVELSEQTGNGIVSAVFRHPTSTIATDKEENGPENPINSAKYEGSRQTSVVDNEVSKTPSECQPVFDSAQGEMSNAVCVKALTEEAEIRPATASESVKEDGIESAGSTEGNADITEERSENQLLNAECLGNGEGNRPVSAVTSEVETMYRPTSPIVKEEFSVERGESRVSAKEDSRPGSAKEYAKEGIGAIGDVESTKEDENRSETEATKEDEEESNLHSATGLTQGEEGGLIHTAELAKEEASRPNDDAVLVRDEGTTQATDAESIKDEATEQVSTNGEVDLAKEEAGMQMVAADSGNEEETNQGNTAESISELSRPVSLSDSTKDERSRAQNVAADDTGPTQTSQSRSVSASGSIIEENSVTENVENSAESTRNKPLSATESIKEGSQTVSSADVKRSSTEEQSVPGVEDESEEVAPEPIDVQIAEHEIGKTTRSPSSAAPSADTQERTEDGRSTAEVGNDSGPPSALLSIGAESETTKEASEQGLLSSGVGGTTEGVESPTSTHTDDIPSLTVTETVDDPGSDGEAGPSVSENKPGEDEKRAVTEGADDKMTVVDETQAQNTAATMIQASFRGYQTRQALSKAAEKDEVPQSVMSHDFLFGPEVQPSLAVEDSTVDGTPRDQETEERQQEADNELMELQKPQECDEFRAPPKDASDDLTGADSSMSTAATKIQAGVRGFLARRHVHNMIASNSTTAPSIGDSQQSLRDTITSQEMEDEGVHVSGSMETEVQKQHPFSMDEEISQSQENTTTTKNVKIENGLSLDSHMKEKAQRTAVTKSAISLHLDGPVNEDEDRNVWQTLQQEELDDAATKIQSSYRGYRMRRSLKREDAVQMTTTSTSSNTASSDVIPNPMRHTGEFHDMMVLPPSPEEDINDTSARNHVVTASSTPLQSDDDVTPAAGNKETDMTESKQGGEAKMDETATVSEAEAATRIKASHHGFETRQDIKTANLAASKIQAGFRGYKVRKQLREHTEEDNKNGPRSQGSLSQSSNQEEEEEEVRATNGTPAGDIEDKSATMIQAGVRGYLVRKRRQAESDAAVKIQAGFRGYQARREVKARQQQQQQQQQKKDPRRIPE